MNRKSCLDTKQRKITKKAKQTKTKFSHCAIVGLRPKSVEVLIPWAMRMPWTMCPAASWEHSLCFLRATASTNGRSNFERDTQFQPTNRYVENVDAKKQFQFRKKHQKCDCIRMQRQKFKPRSYVNVSCDRFKVKQTQPATSNIFFLPLIAFVHCFYTHTEIIDDVIHGIKTA